MNKILCPLCRNEIQNYSVGYIGNFAEKLHITCDDCHMEMTIDLDLPYMVADGKRMPCFPERDAFDILNRTGGF